MKRLFIIFASIIVLTTVARNIEDNASSIAGAYKDYDDMYNGGYLSEQEKKIIGVEEDSKYNINHVFTTSFKAIKNNITPQWHSFKKQQNIYDISNLDMSSYRQQHFYKLQDLGTYGTPAKLFKPTINNKISQTNGYEAFNLYKLDDIIYDTRAPILGFRTIYNKYSNSFDINMFFATSLNKNIHFGISGRPIFQERLFGGIEKQHKRDQNKIANMHVMQIPLAAYLCLHSDDNKHCLYLRLAMDNRKISETGGLQNNFAKSSTMFTHENNIDDDDIIKTNDVVYQGLIYYQYRFQNFYGYIKNKFKIQRYDFNFNIEEKLEQQNDNTQRVIINDKDAHKKTIQYLFANSDDVVYDNNDCCNQYKPFSTIDKFISNNFEAGIKKGFSPHCFLRGFIQINLIHRSLRSEVYDNNTKQLILEQNNPKDFGVITEPLILGGKINIYDVKISGKAVLLKMKNFKIEPCLYFKISAKYEKHFFNISLDIIRQQVPEIFKYYSTCGNNIRQYDHDTKDQFKPPFKISLTCDSNIRLLNSKILIKPYGNIVLHTNHLFFVQTKKTDNSSCEPKQNNEWLLDIHKGVWVKINIAGPLFIDIDCAINKRFEIQNSNPYDLEQNNNEILNNIPFLDLYSRIYLHKNFANGSASIATGFDILLATQHIADKYDPITQQFFQQNIIQAQSIEKYPIINAFFNFRFGNFAFSAKLNNLLQMLGILYINYCNTPYYPTFPTGYTLTMQYIFVG